MNKKIPYMVIPINTTITYDKEDESFPFANFEGDIGDSLNLADIKCTDYEFKNGKALPNEVIIKPESIGVTMLSEDTVSYIIEEKDDNYEKSNRAALLTISLDKKKLKLEPFNLQGERDTFLSIIIYPKS